MSHTHMTRHVVKQEKIAHVTNSHAKQEYDISKTNIQQIEQCYKLLRRIYNKNDQHVKMNEINKQ